MKELYLIFTSVTSLAIVGSNSISFLKLTISDYLRNTKRYTVATRPV